MGSRALIASLRALCHDIDAGRAPRRIDWKRLLAPMAAPAVGLALLAGGCGVAHERMPDDEDDPTEICDNRLDDDLDGLVDCDDLDCLDDAACADSPVYGVPFVPEACDNGVDDDLDGLTDCLDPDCAEDPDCAPVVPAYMAPPPELREVDCCNGIDDDGDGALDCSDEDCWDMSVCFDTLYAAPFEELCDDGRDDDCDGLTDCDDDDCLWACGGSERYAAPFPG